MKTPRLTALLLLCAAAQIHAQGYPAKAVRIVVAPLLFQSQGIDQGTAATPEAHAAFVKSDIVRWGKIIKKAGGRVE